MFSVKIFVPWAPPSFVPSEFSILTVAEELRFFVLIFVLRAGASTRIGGSEASCGEGANGGVVFIGVFGVCAFGESRRNQMFIPYCIAAMLD